MKKLLEQINQQKRTLDNIRPFEPKLLSQLKEYFRIGLTYSSNALEGNSLTESETKVILEDGITVAGKPLRDIYEAEGHSKAFDYIFEIYKEEISEEKIKQIHKLFYEQIDKKKAGIYRDVQAIISGSRYPLPKPTKIKSLCESFMNGIVSKKEVLHPVELSAWVHKQFVFIHPFEDGNGRVARLLMNLNLLNYGYLPAIIPPILRAEYIQLLEKAHTNDSEFIEFIAKRVYETQKEVIKLLNL